MFDMLVLKMVQDLLNVKDFIVFKGGFVESDLFFYVYMLFGNFDEIVKVVFFIVKEMKLGVVLIIFIDNLLQIMIFIFFKGKVIFKVMKVYGFFEGDVVVN